MRRNLLSGEESEEKRTAQCSNEGAYLYAAVEDAFSCVGWNGDAEESLDGGKGEGCEVDDGVSDVDGWQGGIESNEYHRAFGFESWCFHLVRMNQKIISSV